MQVVYCSVGMTLCTQKAFAWMKVIGYFNAVSIAIMVL